MHSKNEKTEVGIIVHKEVYHVAVGKSVGLAVRILLFYEKLTREKDYLWDRDDLLEIHGCSSIDCYIYFHFKYVFGLKDGPS